MPFTPDDPVVLAIPDYMKLDGSMNALSVLAVLITESGTGTYL